MSRLFVFADESGCFTFNNNQNVSKYFVLCTIVMDNCAVGAAILDLRRKLAWDGLPLDDFFHATTDKQAVRDAVFAEIVKHEFLVQATIMEKAKAEPQVTVSRARFYKTGYFFHFKHGVSKHLPPDREALVTTATIGNKKEKRAFRTAIDDVMNQTNRAGKWATDFLPCSCDPCLQVADYCAWAIQRKYESPQKNQGSFDMISDRISYKYELWSHGRKKYY
jgi:hypothetical protein